MEREQRIRTKEGEKVSEKIFQTEAMRSGSDSRIGSIPVPQTRPRRTRQALRYLSWNTPIADRTSEAMLKAQERPDTMAPYIRQP